MPAMLVIPTPAHPCSRTPRRPGKVGCKWDGLFANLAYKRQPARDVLGLWRAVGLLHTAAAGRSASPQLCFGAQKLRVRCS